MAEADSPPHPPLFRPPKRRKVLRTRNLSSSPEPTPSAPTAVSNTAAESPLTVETNLEKDSTTPSVSEVVRLRKPGRTRRQGIGFAAAHRLARSEDTEATTLAVISAQDEDGAALISRRFAPQTGMVAEELDKHMMEYIDSRMGNRKPRHLSSDVAHLESQNALTSRFAKKEHIMKRQPAGAGKLEEIDLGPATTLRNIARTEEATRRLQGASGAESDSVDDAAATGRKKRWRGRKRRTSEDLRRDKLVEEILKETKLDLYIDPNAPQTTTDKNNQPPNTSDASMDAEPADDRVAEQFRQEFLDAQANRLRAQRRNPAASGTHSGASRSGASRSGASRSGASRSGIIIAGSAAEEKAKLAKGPKLGGSRSARAAMIRAIEEKLKEEEGRKGKGGLGLGRR